jgi:hypothetical protein
VNITEAKLDQIEWKQELEDLTAEISALRQMPAIARHLRFQRIILLERRRRHLLALIRAQRTELVGELAQAGITLDGGPGTVS